MNGQIRWFGEKDRRDGADNTIFHDSHDEKLDRWQRWYRWRDHTNCRPFLPHYRQRSSRYKAASFDQSRYVYTNHDLRPLLTRLPSSSKVARESRCSLLVRQASDTSVPAWFVRGTITSDNRYQIIILVWSLNINFTSIERQTFYKLNALVQYQWIHILLYALTPYAYFFNLSVAYLFYSSTIRE